MYWIFLVLVFLFVLVFLIHRKERKTKEEGFSGSSSSHTVNLPINTRESCKNTCGPPNRCSITGEQCTSDVDCYGCQGMSSPDLQGSSGEDVPGYYDAGNNKKNPYSVLTMDATKDAGSLTSTTQAPPVYFQGVNTWRQAFDAGNALYNQKYNPSLAFQPFLPQYTARPTLSGEFVDDGPPAANS
jgi:hypothetical protein